MLCTDGSTRSTLFPAAHQLAQPVILISTVYPPPHYFVNQIFVYFSNTLPAIIHFIYSNLLILYDFCHIFYLYCTIPFPLSCFPHDFPAWEYANRAKEPAPPFPFPVFFFLFSLSKRYYISYSFLQTQHHTHTLPAAETVFSVVAFLFIMCYFYISRRWCSHCPYKIIYFCLSVREFFSDYLNIFVRSGQVSN